MIESTRMPNGFIKLTATTGVIHKIGTDTYVQSVIMLPSDTMEMYEEVSEKPAYTKEEYDNKVAELVRERYSESEEFAIQRKAINAICPTAEAVGTREDSAMAEYEQYNAFVEECKVQAKLLLVRN